MYFFLLEFALLYIIYFFVGGSFVISKMEFFEEWVKTSSGGRNVALFNFIATKQDLGSISEQSLKDIKAVISRFSAKLSEKWENSRRIRDRFLTSNKSWLEGDITFRTQYDTTEPSTSSQKPMAGPGRPKIDLKDAAAFKTKRRRVDDLIQSRSSEELLAAAEISSRLSGTYIYNYNVCMCKYVFTIPLSFAYLYLNLTSVNYFQGRELWPV